MPLPTKTGMSSVEVERIVESMLLEKFGVLHHHRIAGQVPGAKIEDDAVTSAKIGDVGLGSHFGDRSVSSPISNAIGTANDADYTACFIPHQVTLTGIRYRVGGTSSGNVKAAIYDSAGNIVIGSNGVAQVAANNVQSVSFTATTQVQPGLYFMGLIFSSATATRFVVNGIIPSIIATANGDFSFPASITPPTAQDSAHTLMTTH